MLRQEGMEGRVFNEGLKVGLVKGALGNPARDGETLGRGIAEVKASHNSSMV